MIKILYYFSFILSWINNFYQGSLKDFFKYHFKKSYQIFKNMLQKIIVCFSHALQHFQDIDMEIVVPGHKRDPISQLWTDSLEG